MRRMSVWKGTDEEMVMALVLADFLSSDPQFIREIVTTAKGVRAESCL